MSLNGSDDQNASPRPPVCDICWHKGQKNSLSELWICRTCHVAVHPECYELGSLANKNKRWREAFECWACQAVGKTVKFRERDEQGHRLTATITQRPTECCLCASPDTNPHAMHPLFDDYGPRARQIRLKDSNTPAWVHTLCAVVVAGHTRGLVYACNRHGFYGGPQAEDDTERIVQDDDSVNSELQDKKDSANGDAKADDANDGHEPTVAEKDAETKKPKDADDTVADLPLSNNNDDDDRSSDSDSDSDGEEDDATHHYTYVIERWYEKNQPHVKLGRNLRALKCQGCGKSGNRKNSYLTAIECMANTSEEFQQFKKLKCHAVRFKSFTNSSISHCRKLCLIKKLLHSTARSMSCCISRRLRSV